MSENMTSDVPVYVLCWNKQPDKNDDVILREKDKFPEFQFGTHWMMWSYNENTVDMYRTKFLYLDDPGSEMDALEFDDEGHPYFNYYKDSVYIWKIKETSLNQIFELSDYDVEDMELLYFNGMVQPFDVLKKMILISSAKDGWLRICEIAEELKIGRAHV